MKLKIISIIGIILAVSILFVLNGGINILGRSSTAFAVGDLEVDWGVPSGNPIFVVTNLLPGDLEQRSVKVTNNASVSRPVGVRGVKTSSNPANFPNVLTFVIMQGATTLYGPVSLAQFFADSASPTGIPLSTLASGENATYTFKVTFPSSAGNEFQKAKVIFDLIIGLSMEVPTECQGIKFDGNPIFGTEKDDKIEGGLGNDLIFGLGGKDKINGNNGNDCIIGGDGDDVIHGNNGNDVILGEVGNDSLKGENGKDLLIGGEGNDDLEGGNNDDTLLGKGGDDNLSGGNGADHLEGQEGKDSLDGGNGNDFLDGGPGNSDSGNGRIGTDTCLNLETQLNCEL